MSAHSVFGRQVSAASSGLGMTLAHNTDSVTEGMEEGRSPPSVACQAALPQKRDEWRAEVAAWWPRAQ